MDIGRRDGGGLVVALGKKLAFYDPACGAMDVFAEVEQDRPDNRFNDGKVDRRGRYWAGGMDAQPLWASRLVSRSAITALLSGPVPRPCLATWPQRAMLVRLDAQVQALRHALRRARGWTTERPGRPARSWTSCGRDLKASRSSIRRRAA